MCTLTVTGREYARLKAIADTFNTLAGETPNYGCDSDNTPATVFAGFFVSFPATLEQDNYIFVAQDVAGAGWCDAEEINADEDFAKSE